MTTAKIKICGLSREEDIRAANELVPDYIGFVFADSRRRVDVNTAAGLRKILSPKILSVGVFVNSPINKIIDIYNRGIINLAQLHGREDEGYIKMLRESAGIKIIKAVRVNTQDDIIAVQNSSADYLLLDSGSGGTGIAFDWSLIKRIDKPYFIAGGVNIGNIKTALSLKPFGIDVSSGAESDGVKDRDKMAALIQAVREEIY